jgi:hypothetical protein
MLLQSPGATNLSVMQQKLSGGVCHLLTPMRQPARAACGVSSHEQRFGTSSNLRTKCPKQTPHHVDKSQSVCTTGQPHPGLTLTKTRCKTGVTFQLHSGFSGPQTQCRGRSLEAGVAAQVAHAHGRTGGCHQFRQLVRAFVERGSERTAGHHKTRPTSSPGPKSTTV